MEINDTVAKKWAKQLKEIRRNTPEIYDSDDQVYFKMLEDIESGLNGIKKTYPGMG